MIALLRSMRVSMRALGPLRAADAVGSFAGAALLCASLQAHADEARYDVVVDAPGNLKALVESNLSLIRWRDADGRRGRIDADQLRRLFDQGKDEIERLVATEGYYAPTVDADLQQTGDRWTAHYRIEPNAVTTVDAVDLQFVGPVTQAPGGQLPDLKALRDGWTLVAGNVFRQADWEANKRRLLQGFLIRTYPFASLTRSEAQVDIRNDRAKLVVVVASGPAVRFGPLQISGLKRYPADTIRNLTPIRIGELYSQQQVFDFQQKLVSSGFFSRVEVSIDAEADPGTDPRSPFVAPKVVDSGGEPGADPMARTTPITPATNDAPATPLPREVTLPLRVAVDENLSKSLSVGVGYTSNSGPRASLAYNVIDFLGGAKQLRTNLSIDQLNQTLGADLLFPTTALGNTYSISSNIKREDIQGQTTRGGGITAKQAWGPEATERYNAIDLLFERKDIDEVPQKSTSTLGFTTAVTLRRTDNILSPSTGYLATGQVGAGVRLTNGLPFGRAYGKALLYRPITDNDTLVVRGELGLVAATDTESLPTALLFRAGGDGSVRGYGYQSLGVRQAGAIVGGRYLATGAIEVDHWLAPKYPQWGIAGFVDAGNAGNRLSDLRPVVGAGVGVRWRSPVGILDVDFAHGLDNGTTRIHFSLGVSF